MASRIYEFLKIEVRPKAVYIFLGVLSITLTIFYIGEFIYNYDYHIDLTDKEIYIRLLVVAIALIIGFTSIVLELKTKKLGYIGPALVLIVYLSAAATIFSEIWILPDDPGDDIFSMLILLLISGGITSLNALHRVKRGENILRLNIYSAIGVIVMFFLLSNIEYCCHFPMEYIPYTLAIILGIDFIYLFIRNLKYWGIKTHEKITIFLLIAALTIFLFPR